MQHRQIQQKFSYQASVPSMRIKRDELINSRVHLFCCPAIISFHPHPSVLAWFQLDRSGHVNSDLGPWTSIPACLICSGDLRKGRDRSHHTDVRTIWPLSVEVICKYWRIWETKACIRWHCFDVFSWTRWRQLRESMTFKRKNMWIELLNAHFEWVYMNRDYSIQSISFVIFGMAIFLATKETDMHSFGTLCAVWWPPELLKCDFIEGLSLQANEHCPPLQCQLMYAAPVPCLNLTLSRTRRGANLLHPPVSGCLGSMPTSMPGHVPAGL